MTRVQEMRCDQYRCDGPECNEPVTYTPHASHPPDGWYQIVADRDTKREFHSLYCLERFVVGLSVEFRDNSNGVTMTTVGHVLANNSTASVKPAA